MADIVQLDPTTTNLRHQEPDCVYHLYNRIAHSVRFLNEEEKDDLLDRVFRVSEFCGIKLLSWCLMTNHFHILIYLPHPYELTKEEIKRRFSLLLQSERAVFYDGFTLDRAPQELTKRMFNIGMFMKIVKENFTIAYNERTGHHGTMWEGPYRFKAIPMNVRSMSTVAAYQNLNPVRACLAADYTSYRWTSFASAAKGGELAHKGLNFIFGGYEFRDTERTNLSDKLVHSNEELISMMQDKMDADLESFKRDRAEAVWRKRLSGQSAQPPDPLTDEAMVAQVEARMLRLQSANFRDELAKMLGRRVKDDEVRVIRAMAADPQISTPKLAEIVGVSGSRVKRISILFQKAGIIRREGSLRRSFWRLMSVA